MGRHFLLHKNDIKILKNCLEATTYNFLNGHSCCSGDGLELVWSSCTLEREKMSHGTWVTPKTLISLLDPGSFSVSGITQYGQPSAPAQW